MMFRLSFSSIGVRPKHRKVTSIVLAGLLYRNTSCRQGLKKIRGRKPVSFPSSTKSSLADNLGLSRLDAPEAVF